MSGELTDLIMRPIKPERWMVPCRYCRKNPCLVDQYPHEIIGRSMGAIPEEESEFIVRAHQAAGLRFGTCIDIGSACPTLNKWLITGAEL